MSQEHVIHALVRKYAELAGQLRKLNAETAQIAEQLEHVRATILIFQPGYHIKSIAPKRPKQKSSYGPKGKLIRLVLEALRDAREPVSAREIAERVLTARGVLARISRMRSRGGDLKAEISVILQGSRWHPRGWRWTV